MSSSVVLRQFAWSATIYVFFVASVLSSENIRLTVEVNSDDYKLFGVEVFAESIDHSEQLDVKCLDDDCTTRSNGRITLSFEAMAGSKVRLNYISNVYIDRFKEENIYSVNHAEDYIEKTLYSSDPEDSTWYGGEELKTLFIDKTSSLDAESVDIFWKDLVATKVPTEDKVAFAQGLFKSLEDQELDAKALIPDSMNAFVSTDWEEVSSAAEIMRSSGETNVIVLPGNVSPTILADMVNTYLSPSLVTAADWFVTEAASSSDGFYAFDDVPVVSLEGMAIDGSVWAADSDLKVGNAIEFGAWLDVSDQISQDYETTLAKYRE